MAKAKLKTRILLADSLRGMPIGSTLVINNREFKAGTIRSAATDLKKEGYLFRVSDRGRIDDVVVTRLK